jgi:hypothetical protein
MALTDVACKQAKPREKTYRMYDTRGLYLEVAPRGGKWWRLKYRLGGREKRVSLGTYPDTSLRRAREKRAPETVQFRAAFGMQEPIELRFDRPFLFVIHDDTTGAALFAGRVESP